MHSRVVWPAVRVAVVDAAVGAEPIVIITGGLVVATVKFADVLITAVLEVGRDVDYVVTVAKWDVAVVVRDELFKTNLIELRCRRHGNRHW